MENNWKHFDLVDAEVKILENFIDSSKYFQELLEKTPWRQDKIVVYGKEYDVPRLQQWYGDSEKAYTFSGIKMEPLPWTESLRELKGLVEEVCDTKFNSVLLNHYRNGDDTVGWHADDEYELGYHPVIASVSLGETRDFVLRKNSDYKEKLTIPLTDGSLLLMSGATQKSWQHSLPRRKGILNPRINLTFRKIS